MLYTAEISAIITIEYDRLVRYHDFSCRGHYKTVFALMASKFGILPLLTELISNSIQSLVHACSPDALHTCVQRRCTNVWLKCILTRIWLHRPVPWLDGVKTSRWCSRRKKSREGNRVKNFHKWTSNSKAHPAFWRYDCSYTSSSSTLELIPSFSLLCSQMSSCRQCCG